MGIKILEPKLRKLLCRNPYGWETKFDGRGIINLISTLGIYLQKLLIPLNSSYCPTRLFVTFMFWEQRLPSTCLLSLDKPLLSWLILLLSKLKEEKKLHFKGQPIPFPHVTECKMLIKTNKCNRSGKINKVILFATLRNKKTTSRIYEQEMWDFGLL